MKLTYDLIQKLQNEPAGDAWRSILEHAWGLCTQPIADGKAEAEVMRRDRALADVDLYLATAGWGLWSQYEASVPLTVDVLADLKKVYAAYQESPGRLLLEVKRNHQIRLVVLKP